LILVGVTFAKEKAGLGIDALGLNQTNLADFVKDFQIVDLFEENLKYQKLM